MSEIPQGQRILVTGAGGLVGGAISVALARRGHRVFAVYRKTVPCGLEGSGDVTLLQADLRDPGVLPGHYEALVHCAAEVPALCADENELYRSNVEGTRTILGHAAEAGATCIVYCSSMAVYGTIEENTVDVATPIRTPGPYGRSKLEGERLLAGLIARNPAIRGMSVRLPGVVGAGSRNNFLSDILPRILAGERVRARNPDALFNNIVHVADLADFAAHLLEAMPEGHTITTMAADVPIPIREVMKTLFQTAGLPERVEFSTAGRPFLISPEPARALGYAVPDVRDSLRRFVRDSRGPSAGPGEGQSG